VEPIESHSNEPLAGGEPAHYLGIVVIVPPDRVDTCARNLDSLVGVEVHYRHSESGRIVAVLESRNPEDHQDTMRRIQAAPDVLVAAPVYHYVDATSEDAEVEASSPVERMKETQR
jgi:nitrate reductase NapAB chaperone NapD